MKKIVNLLVLGALMVCLAPVKAQTAQQTQTQAQIQDWQSTSSLRESGSAYSPQVNAVGAPAAPYMATTTTTTEDYTPSPNGPRRIGNFGTPADTERDEESPIGDAMLPLLALACMYALYNITRVYRRKRRV